MATANDYLYIQQIDDLQFFQGDTVTIPFSFVNGNNQPIDLRYYEVWWYLCPYGRYKSPTLVLNSVDLNEFGIPEIIIDDGTPNICYVNLDDSLTKELDYVKYTHQPVVVLRRNNKVEKYLRAEGNILFKPEIRDFE